MRLAAVLLVSLAVPGLTSPLVVASTEDLAAIARAIAGDEVRVEFLAPGTANTHTIELKPSYAMKLVKARAIIRVGLGLDNWMLSLIENSRNRALVPGAPGHIDASEGCALLDTPDGPVDRSMGDVHPFGNPHYLLDPANGLVVARNLARRFSTLFPESAETCWPLRPPTRQSRESGNRSSHACGAPRSSPTIGCGATSHASLVSSRSPRSSRSPGSLPRQGTPSASWS